MPGRAIAIVPIFAVSLIGAPGKAQNAVSPEARSLSRSAAMDDRQARDGSANPAGLSDIIVTAERRSQSVQKASISIAALSSEQLATKGVVDPISLNGVVPGLKLAYVGAQVQTFVRGVGDTTNNAFTQASVSLNMDGVYVARASAFGPLFFDTERVEVLRGPQGTIYGRNSSGGAINIITRNPTLGDLNGYTSLEVGNFGLVRGQAAATIPLGATTALRIAGQITQRSGYLSDGTNDDKSNAVRVKFLWRPTSEFSVLLAGERVDVGGKGFGRVFRPSLFGSDWTGAEDPRINAATFPTAYVRRDNSLDVKGYNTSVQVDWDLGFAKLTVLPAYRRTDATSLQGADFVYDSYEKSDQYSLEARLAGDVGRLNWLVGSYYFDEKQNVRAHPDQRNIVTLNGLVQDQIVPLLKTRAWALFGQGTYSLSYTLRVIGGLRYTDERKHREGVSLANLWSNGGPGMTTSNSLDGSLHEHAATWRGAVEYDLSGHNMLYGSVSRGFKSGGFAVATTDTYRPEYVTAYTLGSKNRFAGGRVQLNVEGFYWKFKDQQVSFLGLGAGNLVTILSQNAGQATLYGADIDAIWKVTANDNIDLGAEYLHTKYDSFIFRTVGAAPTGAAIADGCISDGPSGVPGFFFENCSGHVLPRAPRWSGNARYSHRFDLGNGGNVTFGVSGKFETMTRLSVNWSSPNFSNKAYGLVDLDLTYAAPNNRWTVQAYIRNATDKAVYLNAANANIPPLSGPTRTSIAAIGAPRTFGGRFQANF